MGFFRAILVLFYLVVSMYYLQSKAESSTRFFPDSFYPKYSKARFTC
jgi:hypothetical protein